MSSDRRRVEAELRGRSLDVFLYVMRAGRPVGVRDVQRGLGLSSPSVAYHHLEKLHSLGVLQKDEKGSYTAVEKVDVSVLNSFILVGRRLLPRMSFYAALFTTFTALYLTTHLSSPDPYALTLGLAASAATLYEAVRTWRKKPW
ncbi:MAG: helix-turn-helix domain-containing protein [Candidatus Caldarchaeum sp.]